MKTYILDKLEVNGSLTKFVNLTPHAINVVGKDETWVIPPSGEVARVAETLTPVTSRGSSLSQAYGGPDFYFAEHGEVTGLPPAESQIYSGYYSTWYVVSGMVMDATPDRGDLLKPGKPIRDGEGRVVGCEGLISRPVRKRTLRKLPFMSQDIEEACKLANPDAQFEQDGDGDWCVVAYS